MASERNHTLLREFRFWQMRCKWIPLANMRTRRGRLYVKVYGVVECALAWIILRLP